MEIQVKEGGTSVHKTIREINLAYKGLINFVGSLLWHIHKTTLDGSEDKLPLGHSMLNQQQKNGDSLISRFGGNLVVT